MSGAGVPRRPQAAGWGTVALLLAAALLAGCAQRPGAPAAATSAASAGLGPMRADQRDRITASDEPESLRRARVRLELATAYYSRGQLTTALDEVKQSIAADARIAGAFNLRGLIYADLGDVALAEESFRRALAIDPADADSMQNYGWFLCQQRRYPEAEHMFRQAMEVPRYADTARTLLTKGICQARAGQLETAEATLNRAFELDAGSPVIAVNLSEVLYRRGQFQRASFIMRRVNAQPEVVNAQTLWLAARIERRLGNQQLAEQLGEQLRGRFPKSPEATAYERRQFDE